MKHLMWQLLEAQKTLLANPSTATNGPVVEQLRATVPAPILAHFLRRVAHGQRGVAVVRNGVCAQCHIRLPSSLAAAMVKADEMHVCEQCGTFLVAAETESQPAPAPQPPKATRVRRYTRQLAA